VSMDDLNRKLDDVKLFVLHLLASIWNAGQLVIALPHDDAQCNIDQALEILTLGGELQLTFARPSCRVVVNEMKSFIRAFERGIISKEELMDKLLKCSRHIVEVVRHSSVSERENPGSPTAEIDRLLCLLFDRDDYDRESWEDIDGADLHFPLAYVVQRCRCAVTLIESLVCSRATGLKS
jgi:hypothetical protein